MSNIQDIYREASVETISEEEYLENLIDATHSLEENSAALREATQYEVTLENLEHYAEVIGDIQHATQSELALVKAGTDTALEQHGICASDVFPALESREGETVSMEGIQSVIKAIWDAIVRVVKRIWETITTFFNKIFGINARLEKGNVNLKKRIEAYSGKSMKRKTVDLKTESNIFTVDGKALKDGKAVIAQLDELVNKATVVYGFYADAMIGAGEKLAKEIKDFNPDEPVKSLQATNRIIEEEFNFEALQKLTGGSHTVNDSRWKDDAVHASSPLFKNKTLFYITPKPRGAEDSPLGKAEALRNQRAVLDTTGQGAKGNPTKEKGTISTFSLSEMMTIQQRCSELTKMVEAFEKNHKSIKSVGKKVDAACKGLSSRLEKTNNLSEATKAHYNATVNLSVAYGRWASKPTLELTQLIQAVIRACQTAAHKSLANYE